MEYNEILKNFLNGDRKYSERYIDENNKEICDLETGECHTVKLKDGLIERVDNSKIVNRDVKVETRHGIKQLLKD